MLSCFERLDTGLVTIIVAVFVLLYGTVTLCLLRKKPGKLWIPALVLLAISILFYWRVYDYAAAKAWFPKLVMAVMSATDLFLFRMASSIGNLSGFFFMKNGVVEAGVQNPQAHLILLQGLYICSIWTTSILVMHFLAGRIISRFRLLLRSGRASDGVRTHVFLGTGRLAAALAKSLPAGDRVIFVEAPDNRVLPDKVSFLSLFRGVRSGSSAVERIRETIPGAILLKAKKSMASCTEGPLFEELGLKRLGKWAASPLNCFYLLSEDEEENITALRRIIPVKAQVYYHAKREGVTLKTDLASPENIHVIDSSFLATRALKSDGSMYPIHLVEIARDRDGEPAGYVCSPFHSMVCGFGESGRGALSFLYEFGAFPGKDGKQSPFICEVVDAGMDRILPGYKAAHPALDTNRVSFLHLSTESEDFRELLRQRIGTLNFVFVSLGDDGMNVNLAVEVLEAAFKCGRPLDKLLIAVKLDRPGDYARILSFFNDSYGGRETIRTIGDIDSTWTWDNISEEGYLRYARRFQASYSVSSGDKLPWDMREEQIRRKTESELARRMELRRKVDQDFANYYHVRVKAALCPSRLWETPETAYCIPFRYEGEHYTGNDEKAGRILEYMAIQEHLRWVASHEMAGYRFGEEKREDLMTHPDMRPYEELDEVTRHYDWIVVKTTLNILSSMEYKDNP
jgi:hypothetical protein